MSDTKRRVWGIVWLERLGQDLRYGCRMLAASPGFTAVAIVSLAIGIGANCAIFSFADALLLRPLPVARPGEVMTVGSTASLEALNASTLVASYPEYTDIRDRAKSFEGLAAFTYQTAGLARDAATAPKLKMGMLVSGNLFSLMGVEPTLGRSFRAEENQVPGRDAVVVLGQTLWSQDFGSDPAVLGRTLRINGSEFTVIGVAPSEFTGMNQYVRADFFIPLMMSARIVPADPKTASLEARDARNLTIKGRLKPGVSQAQAQTELTTLAADFERAYPDTNKHRGLVVRTELQARIGQDPPDAVLLAMLSTLAFLVLFVACANVAGLLTSRAPVRAREMALRLAIGASRGRLVRQLVTESLLLAIGGGVLGLLVGYAGMSLFRQIELPTDLPILLSFRMDRRALVFSLSVAVASAVIFGLIPAVQAARTDLTAVMKTGDTAAPGRRRRWGRAVLVTLQVAVSVILLVVALFMYRGFSRELAQGPGYRTDHLLMMTVDTNLMRYTEPQALHFFEQVADRVRAVPGVKDVAITSTIPMANDSIGAVPLAPEGFQFPPGKESMTILTSKIDEHYFDAMGLTILRGRNFRIEDAPGTPPVAIVNEQFVKHFWPGQDAIGKRIQLLDADRMQVQVIGVVRTSKYVFIAEPPSDFIYVPYRQKPQQRMAILTHSIGDPATLAGPLREAVRGLDSNLPIYNVRTMAEFYRMRAVSIFNVLVGIVAAMGVMGLGLAIVGLYGLVAYAATRRTREIGIRMAIGASRTTVLRMMLKQGAVLAGIGLVIGLAGSVAAGRLLAAAFPNNGGNDQADYMALLLVIPVVLAVTFLATFMPARRAARVNPMTALRYE